MGDTRKPNVVFILTDDQGYGDLGCHGNTVIRTPSIDAFHAEAARFTNFHVGTTCAPTRAGLLTGHYCNSAGVWHTIGGRSLLREDEWTLANALREAGYRTGHFGKWHLGDSPPFRPHERGFERSVYHAGGGVGNTGDHWGNDYFDDTYFVNGSPARFSGYCTDVFFEQALRFIRDNAAEPFFCYIATNAPHGPLNVENRYWEPYRDGTPTEDRARFYGMITNIDENVAALRRTLRQLGIEEETIFVFMTDNGTATGVDLDGDGFPVERPGSYNAGMRGKKGSEYDGGHRVPFFIRYPGGGIDGGWDIDALTSYTDFMPTILDLCDVAVPPERSFHGLSLRPALEGRSQPELQERITVADTQRIAHPVKWRKSSVMKSSWRLVNGTELFDIAADPSERRDVSADHPGVVAELRRGYDAWWGLVSSQFLRDTPIALGQDQEPVKLTTHDLRNDTCSVAWNQGQVRAGMVCAGYWAVDVRNAGRYRIELRRWPEETGRALAAGIEGDDVEWRRDCIQEKHAAMYSGGEAVPIRWARLAVGGRAYHVEVKATDEACTFEVDLLEGPDELSAAFFDRRERTMAPYYVYVCPVA
jgi:arylsulfatase A-like enzyme